MEERHFRAALSRHKKDLITVQQLVKTKDLKAVVRFYYIENGLRKKQVAEHSGGCTHRPLLVPPTLALVLRRRARSRRSCCATLAAWHAGTAEAGKAGAAAADGAAAP